MSRVSASTAQLLLLSTTPATASGSKSNRYPYFELVNGVPGTKAAAVEVGGVGGFPHGSVGQTGCGAGGALPFTSNVAITTPTTSTPTKITRTRCRPIRPWCSPRE